MENRAVALVALFAWICVTTVAQDSTVNTQSSECPAEISACECFVDAGLASFTDDQCPGITYCGTFCCPGDRGPGTQCCPDEQRCCGAINETTVAPAFCGSDLARCPNSLPPDEVYDGNNELRGECCVYFRSGCCSPSENQTLDLLFKLAIGLGVGLFTLLLIIGLLVLCICCCVCCD